MVGRGGGTDRALEATLPRGHDLSERGRVLCRSEGVSCLGRREGVRDGRGLESGRGVEEVRLPLRFGRGRGFLLCVREHSQLSGIEQSVSCRVSQGSVEEVVGVLDEFNENGSYHPLLLQASHARGGPEETGTEYDSQGEDTHLVTRFVCGYPQQELNYILESFIVD